MKALIAVSFITSLICSVPSFATDSINGSWKGNLTISPDRSMELIFHFKKQKSGYTATVDVPAQQQFGLEFNSVKVSNTNVELSLDAASIKYSATIDGSELTGVYSQGSFKAPLNLSKTKQVVTRVKKPQENFDNAPYAQELVTFVNQTTNDSLAGTLTLPTGPYKAIAILLSGSGPTTRDGDAFGHKVLAVIADQLTRNGVGVLRFDDRGVGDSTGVFNTATSEDFATDALAAHQFLTSQQRFKNKNIGFVGHSEGGLIGAIASANNPNVSFFVSLAGPGTSGAEILIDQSYHIQKLRGVDAATLAKSDKTQRSIMKAIENGITEEALTELLEEHGVPAKQAVAQSKQLSSSWFKYFVKTDPKRFLARLKTPVLALNGALDSQVLAEKNIAGIKSSVPQNLLTTRIYPGLNHLFQPANSGLPKEYSTIETTFSAKVAKDISQWINIQL
ncbi:MAG: alpha/beta fold hydrolase [Psychrobium sp.]